MGIATSLSSITPTSTENGTSEVYGADIGSLISVAVSKAQELSTTLNTIIARLPGGDTNIATIQSMVTSLS